MSWVCPNCSKANKDSNTYCEVCGYGRPTDSDTLVDETEAIEGKIIFSDIELIDASFKRFFAKFERKGNKKKKSKRPSSDAPKPIKATKKKPEKVKPPKKEKTPRLKNEFAKPWPEHRLKFDIDVIKSKGFVRSERCEINSVKGYKFYTASGADRFMRAEMLVVLGMAKNV